MKFIRLIFGGSFGVVQGVIVAALISAALVFWVDHKATKRENVRLKGEVYIAQLENGWQQTVITSLSGTQERRDGQQAQQLTVEDIINAMPKTNYCAAAPAVGYALDSVRSRRGADAGTTDP